MDRKRDLLSSSIDHWLASSPPIFNQKEHETDNVQRLEHEKLHLQQELARKIAQLDQTLDQTLLQAQNKLIAPIQALTQQLNEAITQFMDKVLNQPQQPQKLDASNKKQQSYDSLIHTIISLVNQIIRLLYGQGDENSNEQELFTDEDNENVESSQRLRSLSNTWLITTRDSVRNAIVHDYLYNELLKERLYPQLIELLDPVLSLHRTSTSTTKSDGGADGPSTLTEDVSGDQSPIFAYFIKNKEQLSKLSALISLMFQMEMTLHQAMRKNGKATSEMMEKSERSPASPLSQDGEQQPRKKEQYLVTQALVQPFIIRFKYHFYGKRSTNRIDSAEYCLTYMSKILEHYAPLVQQWILPLYFYSLSSVACDDANSGDDAVDQQMDNPLNGFTLLLNVELAKKVLHVLSPAIQLITSSGDDVDDMDDASKALFLTTINQILVFDAQLIMIYSYGISRTVMDLVLMDKTYGEQVLRILSILDLSSAERALSALAENQWEPLSASTLILTGDATSASAGAEDLPLLQEWKPSVYAYTLIHTLQSLNDRYRTVNVHHRIELFKRVNSELLQKFFTAVEPFVGMKGLSRNSENWNQWIKHATILNSILYVSTHLRDMSELDFIVEMVPYLRNVSIYDVPSDQCDLWSATMMNQLIKVIMSKVELSFDKYLYAEEVDHESFVDQTIHSLSEQLSILKSYIQTNSFYLLTRRLLADFDRFVFNLLGKDKKYSRAVQSRITNDLRNIVRQVFDPHVINSVPIMTKSSKLLS